MTKKGVSSRKTIGKEPGQTLADFGDGGIIGGKGVLKKYLLFPVYENEDEMKMKKKCNNVQRVIITN